MNFTAVDLPLRASSVSNTPYALLSVILYRLATPRNNLLNGKY